MGFIEKLKQQQRQKELEAEKRSREQALSLTSAKQKADKLLEAQKIEAKRLQKLQEESKSKFEESNIMELLKRLSELKAIERFGHYGQSDGTYLCRVTKFSSEKYDSRGAGGGGVTIYTDVFFNIITNSDGLITFEYSKIFRRRKNISRLNWIQNPDVLEESLEKAYNSPIRKVKREGPSGANPFAEGFGGG